MSDDFGYIGNGVYITYGSRGYNVWFKDNDRKYTFSYDQGYEPYGPPDPEDEYNAMIGKLERWAGGSYKPDPNGWRLRGYDVTGTQQEDAKRALYAIEHQEEYERELRRQYGDETTMEEEDADEPISIELTTK